MSDQPCAVPSCPAMAERFDKFCSVHVRAEQLPSTFTSGTCVLCLRRLNPGDWIVRGTRYSSVKHAFCPPRRPSLGPKKLRKKELLEALE